MFALVVNLKVKPDKVEPFLRGIRENARASLRNEPGCLRFDVHRVKDDPDRFVLYELYADEQAYRVGHRGTAHYAAWRAVAAECVEDGQQAITFCTPAFPEDIPEGRGG